MEYLREPELRERIGETLHGDGVESLFVAFDGPQQIQAILRESSACSILKISDFCREDSTVCLDAFQTDLAARGERTLVLGVGEYAALIGDWTPLDYLWAMRRDGKKFIAPVYDGYSELEKKQKNTAFRPVANPVVFLERTRKLWSYQKFTVPAQVECTGLRAILQKLETGHANVLTVKTGIPLQKHWGKTVDTYGDLYLTTHPGENVQPAMLTEEQWQKILEQPESLDTSFFGVGNYLRLNQEDPPNPYLRLVLAKTKTHAQFRSNFIELLLEYKPQDEDFVELAAGRHELAEQLEGDDIREYLFRLTKIPQVDRIRYLSPGREEERLEILKCVSGRPDLVSVCGIENLEAYLEDYRMEGLNGDMGELIDGYFKAYKMAKLGNCADALPALPKTTHIINRLPTRNALVEKLTDPRAKLYWVDALGCEYLAFLQHHARKNHLEMKLFPGRVKLPSITHLNRDFYDAWPHEKEVIRELDDIKHGRVSRLNREECKKWPLHLLRELEILEELVNRIAMELKSGKYEKIVVAADHGATRLAVVANNDMVWEMPEKGRHGGRCCPAHAFSGELPDNIIRTEDGEWLVVTDYSRFRGSHQASVEVHGGATLEEAIAPVLEFSTAWRLPEITQITEREIRLGPNQQNVRVEIASDKPIEKPCLRLQEHVYPLVQTGEKRYAAEIPVADLQEFNEGEIYVGKDRLSSAVVFRISRGVKTNEGFDDFFD